SLPQPGHFRWGATLPCVIAMATARQSHTATLLPNGNVLVAGGYNGHAITNVEIYDRLTGTWATTNSLNTNCWKHTATLLANGRVLVAGGEDDFGFNLTNTQSYDPAAGAW